MSNVEHTNNKVEFWGPPTEYYKSYITRPEFTEVSSLLNSNSLAEFRAQTHLEGRWIISLRHQFIRFTARIWGLVPAMQGDGPLSIRTHLTTDQSYIPNAKEYVDTINARRYLLWQQL